MLGEFITARNSSSWWMSIDTSPQDVRGAKNARSRREPSELARGPNKRAHFTLGMSSCVKFEIFVAVGTKGNASVTPTSWRRSSRLQNQQKHGLYEIASVYVLPFHAQLS